MLLPRLLPYGLFALANAQSSSSSSGNNGDTSSITGAIERQTPTGTYLSISTTRTLTTSSSAISTAPIVSTRTSGSTTVTTTLGSTTLFGYSTGEAGGNTTSSTSTVSQTFLQGSRRPTTTSLNSTSNGTSTSTVPEATNTQPCNNYPEFCGRSYSNITEVAAHNSPFVKPGNVAGNQALSVTTQLNDGIRLLQGQMHIVNGTPYFCHTTCDILNSGSVTDYLREVKDWVATHPYDVVTILLGNGNYSKVDEYVPSIEASGIVPFAYLPPKIPMAVADWPPLASMILSGKRVVMFLDYEANQTAVPYILDEFSHLWETPFDPVDRSFPCTVQRPPDLNPEQIAQRMYIMNHNLNYDITILGNSLLVPNIPLLNVTNNSTGDGSLGASSQGCADTWGVPPRFLNVDYYNVGNGSVFEVAAKWNNVTYNRPCCGKAASGAAFVSARLGHVVLGLLAVGFFATFV